MFGAQGFPKAFIRAPSAILVNWSFVIGRPLMWQSVYERIDKWVTKSQETLSFLKMSLQMLLVMRHWNAMALWVWRPRMLPMDWRKILPQSRLRRHRCFLRRRGHYGKPLRYLGAQCEHQWVSTNLAEQVTFALKEFVRTPLKGVEVHVQGIKVR